MTDSLFLPLIALASLASAQPAAAPPSAEPAPSQSAKSPAVTQLTAQDRAALRCSAAFAIVANRPPSSPENTNDQAASDQAPAELRERGREFFVVTLAGLMDEHSLDRASVEREVRAEAQDLTATGEADQIMPACLLMLDAAGL